MVEQIEIKEPTNFDVKINDISTSEIKIKTFVSIGDWCPDCKNANPVINHYLGKKTNNVLIKVSVGSKI
ncbi:22011_t:CDS:2, partial [Dentiscutata erythropus]